MGVMERKNTIEEQITNYQEYIEERLRSHQESIFRLNEQVELLKRQRFMNQLKYTFGVLCVALFLVFVCTVIYWHIATLGWQ